MREGSHPRSWARTARGLVFLIALWLIAGGAAAGCSTGTNANTPDIEARLASLEQGLAELGARVEALEKTQGPAPAGPFDARDVRWRDSTGTRSSVASALSNVAAQLEELGSKVNEVESQLGDMKSTVASLNDSVAELQSNHECPPGATRIPSLPNTPGWCVDQYVSSQRMWHHFAAEHCARKGGRLCTYDELVALEILFAVLPGDEPSAGQIAIPDDIPNDSPDLGAVEWAFDSAHLKIPGKDLYTVTGLYFSWPNRGTGNPVLDGTPGLELPFRCCYDR